MSTEATQKCRLGEQIASIVDDPFLAAITYSVEKLSPVHRALILRAERDAAAIHRITA